MSWTNCRAGCSAKRRIQPRVVRRSPLWAGPEPPRVAPDWTRLAARVGNTASLLLADLHGNLVASEPASGTTIGEAVRIDAWGMVLASSPAGRSALAGFGYQGRLLIGGADADPTYAFSAVPGTATGHAYRLEANGFAWNADGYGAALSRSGRVAIEAKGNYDFLPANAGKSGFQPSVVKLQDAMTKRVMAANGLHIEYRVATEASTTFFRQMVNDLGLGDSITVLYVP